jgi:hypothetical protein
MSDPIQPVVWMQVHYKDGSPTKYSKVQTWADDVPLYAHPKDLTDEEIKEITLEHLHRTLGGERFSYLEFARAILRKAQEK